MMKNVFNRWIYALFWIVFTKKLALKTLNVRINEKKFLFCCFNFDLLTDINYV